MNKVDMIITDAIYNLTVTEEQAKRLALGLEGVALGDKLGKANNTVQYLFSVAALLAKAVGACDALLPPAPVISSNTPSKKP